MLLTKEKLITERKIDNRNDFQNINKKIFHNISENQIFHPRVYINGFLLQCMTKGPVLLMFLNST